MRAIAIVSATWPAGPAARRRRLRHQLVSWVALLALAWPSLGPLPWLAAPHAADAHSAPAHQADRDTHEHRHVDVSAIPGTPTHPIDHDCAECRVLKHLARCIPAVPAIDFTAPALAAVVAPPILAELAAPHAQTLPPPARAPPADVA